MNSFLFTSFVWLMVLLGQPSFAQISGNNPPPAEKRAEALSKNLGISLGQAQRVVIAMDKSRERINKIVADTTLSPSDKQQKIILVNEERDRFIKQVSQDESSAKFDKAFLRKGTSVTLPSKNQ
jgi:hypothetical protein